MSKYKIIVEFELDPTTYNIGGLVPEDTPEAAIELVQAMIDGDADVCDTTIVGDFTLLCRGRTKAAFGSVIESPQRILAAIQYTLQEFQRKEPFHIVKGPVNITSLPPNAERDYYEVSVWT